MEQVNKIKKVAIYLRKSRGDEEEDVLVKHRFRLTRIAESAEWKYEVYEEVVSGATIKERPKMKQLLADLYNIGYDGVLIMDVKRLARGEMEDQAEIINAFRNSKTLIITPDRTYDWANRQDRRDLKQQLHESNMEYDTIVDRLMDGKLIGWEMGYWTNGKPPYGYYYDFAERAKAKRVKVLPEQAEVYRDIIESYLSGKSIREISLNLNLRRIPTPGGITPLAGGRDRGWSTNAVNRILSDKFHTGYVVHAKVQGNGHKGKGPAIRQLKSNWLVIKGHHEPLITEEKHQLVLQRLAENRKLPSTVKMRKHLFTGVLYCGKCGHRMTFKKKPREFYERAQCVRSNMDGTKCPQKSIVLNNEVLNEIFTIITRLDEGYLEKLAQNTSLKENNLRLIEELEQSINELKRIFDRVEYGYEVTEAYTATEYKNKKIEYLKNKHDLENDIATLKQKNKNLESESPEKFLTKVDWLKDCWYNDEIPVEEKNKLLHALIDKIVYNRAAGDSVTFDIVYR